MVRVRETQTERSVKITRHGGTNFLSLWNRGRALAEADGDVLKRKIYEISGNNKANFNWIPRRGSYGFLIKRAPRYHGERAAITATPASGLFKLFHCFRFWPSIGTLLRRLRSGKAVYMSLQERSQLSLFYLKWSCICLITRLWIFMQIHNFMNTSKEVEPKWRFITPSKYCSAYCASDILYNSVSEHPFRRILTLVPCILSKLKKVLKEIENMIVSNMKSSLPVYQGLNREHLEATAIDIDISYTKYYTSIAHSKITDVDRSRCVRRSGIRTDSA